MTFDEMSLFLKAWENREGGWDEATRDECAQYLCDLDPSVPLVELEQHLLEPPADTIDRYRSVLAKLVADGVLDEKELSEERELTRSLGIATLYRRGKAHAAYLSEVRRQKKIAQSSFSSV